MHPRVKLPITNLPKVWVSSSLSVNRNKKLSLVIMKNWRNGSSSLKTCFRGKLPITDPPLKFGSPVFGVLTEMENWHWPL